MSTDFHLKNAGHNEEIKNFKTDSGPLPDRARFSQPGYWTERIAHLLQACANDRDKLPAEQSIDIPFHELIKDDIGMVEKIYHKANMAMTAKARNELGRFVDAHRDDYGKVIYDLKGQFGSDPDLLRERFNFYYDAFPVKRGKG